MFGKTKGWVKRTLLTVVGGFLLIGATAGLASAALVGPPFTIRGVAATATDPADYTTWTAIADCTVELVDTKGDWNLDNDVVLDTYTTTTSAALSVSGQNLYNYEIANIAGTDITMDSTGMYQYIIRIYSTGTPKYLAYPNEHRISFNPTESSNKYMSFTMMETAPTVVITDIAVTPATISPDNDGVSDFADIHFTLTFVNAIQDWQKNAAIKVTVDTNKDGEFLAFPHQSFYWDENGGPYVYMSTAGNVNTIDLNLSTWSWFNDLTSTERRDYKLTWDKFNALQANYDWSREEWVGSNWVTNNSASISINWEGKDQNWNAVANGVYSILVQVDMPWWNPSDGIDYENSSLSVTVQTSGISGTITEAGTQTAIAGVRVNAGGMNGWGSSFTKSNGTYAISGLPPGKYWVNTESGNTGYPNANYPNEVTVTAGQTTPNINFELERGGSVAGTITIPSPGFQKYLDPWDPQGTRYITNGWLNVEAWSPMSPQHGWAGFNVEYEEEDQAQTIDYILYLPGGTYNVRSQMEGYASTTYKAIEVVSGATTPLNITMQKAGSISGTVSLPEGDTAPSGGFWVDISAMSTDGLYFGWGGTHMQEGAASTTYNVRSLPDATYTVKYQIWGQYKSGESDKIVVAEGARDVTGKNYTFAAGAKITGKLTISGDTSDYKMWEGDTAETISLWLNAWSPSSCFGVGSQVIVPKGVNQSVTYTIGGLGTGEYFIDCWMFGYEMSPRPLKITIGASDTVVSTGTDITLTPYSGSISGTVTGFSTASKVRVTVREPWWGGWQAPLYSDIDSAGAFSVTGLGTGEYIVTVNEYEVKPSTSQPMGMPTGQFGTVTERKPLANGETLTDLVLELSPGSSISGSITINSATYTIADLNGQMVTAVPMKMQWMGWAAPYIGMVNVSGGEAKYMINGLSEDIYIVVPPLYLSGSMGGPSPVEIARSLMPKKYEGEEESSNDCGMPQPDVAGERRQVTVGSGEDITGVNFALSDGYTIKGSIQRPVSGEEDHLWLGLFKTGGDWSEIASTQVQFTEWTSNLAQKTATFRLEHVLPGNYMIRVWPWKMRYKVATKEVKLGEADVDIGTIIVAKGATIKGKLVDLGTGEAVTDDNGVVVFCEARPWVEGSWRSTNDGDPESKSDIWTIQGTQKTGEFKLKNLPAGTYMLEIVSEKAERGVSSNKNYSNMYVAGIIVPDSTEEVDIGTIKLREGATISGRVTNAVGTGLANIWMEAGPSAAKGKSVFCKGKTDANGYYTIKGIDPSIGYWDVCAAIRPDWMEGIKVKYGEKEKFNIAPNATDINFVLEQATANVSGKVFKAAGVNLMIPFPGEEMPVALILLQNEKFKVTEPMYGIEEITTPSGVFNIQGIVPGTYTLNVYSKGTATKRITGIEVVAGNNDVGNIQLEKGGKVTGTIKNQDGTNINTAMFELPLAITSDFSILTFGTFVSNDITKEIVSYSVEGLKPGIKYYVCLAADEGAEIFVSTTTVTVSSADEVVTNNIIYQDNPPSFIVGALKVSLDTDGDGVEDTDKFYLSVWASEILTESDASDIITISSATAAGALTDLFMSPNKRDLSATYTPTATENQFTITVTAHDALGQKGTGTYTFEVGVEAYNLIVINPLMGGKMVIGNGDSTGVELPPGAIDTTDNVTVDVTKVRDVTVAGVTVNASPSKRILPAAAYPSIFIKAATIRRADNDDGTEKGVEVSAFYNYKIGSHQVADGKTVKITLQYDADDVPEGSDIDIYWCDIDSAMWVKEDTNKVIDTVNNVISADVDHLSLFGVFTTLAAPPTGTDTYTGAFKVYAYPNPFKPTAAITATNIKVCVPTSMTSDLTANLKIYTINGELVYEKTQLMLSGVGPSVQLAGEATSDTTWSANWAGENIISWDGKNSSGKNVASGVYIYLLKIAGKEETGKIAVIR